MSKDSTKRCTHCGASQGMPHFKGCLITTASASIVNDTKYCEVCGVAEGSEHLLSCTHHPLYHTYPIDSKINNDGSNANTTHYNLPPDATEVKHLIWYKNMNAQVGEIFRAVWRLGTAGHSSKERDLRKIIAYAEQELERMKKYE